MPRLLKEPEGCNVSSLRKILLLQFSDPCLEGSYAPKGQEDGMVRSVPSCGLGEVGGLD